MRICKKCAEKQNLAYFDRITRKVGTCKTCHAYGETLNDDEMYSVGVSKTLSESAIAQSYEEAMDRRKIQIQAREYKDQELAERLTKFINGISQSERKTFLDFWEKRGK